MSQQPIQNEPRRSRARTKVRMPSNPLIGFEPLESRTVLSGAWLLVETGADQFPERHEEIYASNGNIAGPSEAMYAVAPFRDFEDQAEGEANVNAQPYFAVQKISETPWEHHDFVFNPFAAASPQLTDPTGPMLQMGAFSPSDSALPRGGSLISQPDISLHLMPTEVDDYISGTTSKILVTEFVVHGPFEGYSFGGPGISTSYLGNSLFGGDRREPPAATNTASARDLYNSGDPSKLSSGLVAVETEGNVLKEAGASLHSASPLASGSLSFISSNGTVLADAGTADGVDRLDQSDEAAQKAAPGEVNENSGSLEDSGEVGARKGKAFATDATIRLASALRSARLTELPTSADGWALWHDLLRVTDDVIFGQVATPSSEATVTSEDGMVELLATDIATAPTTGPAVGIASQTPVTLQADLGLYQAFERSDLPVQELAGEPHAGPELAQALQPASAEPLARAE